MGGTFERKTPPLSTTAMTVQDVVTYLNVDSEAIYQMGKRGDLPGFEMGGS